MPKVRRRVQGVKPPAEAKKRFTYDDGATDPAPAAAKAKDQAEKPAAAKAAGKAKQ
jgi:hypothetical protein